MCGTSSIESYLDLAIKASIAAMREITLVYNSHFAVDYKDDDSPVTLADRKADTIIRRHLESAGYYVMSEEVPVISFAERRNLEHIWIVDPLDGTKEFIRRNGEFTTNIALIENGVPLLGVIGIPVSDEIYFGATGLGSFKATLHSAGNSLAELLPRARRLPFARHPRPVRIMGSRSHINRETKLFYQQVRKIYPEAEIISGGSSVKLCRIAEGSIDIYPRFSPINEWDVAAGDAIIRYAGGNITDPRTDELLSYNKENLLHYPFVATAPGFTFNISEAT